jgi:hypothetical protein
MRVLIIQQGSKDCPPIKSNKYDLAVLNDNPKRCILTGESMILPEMSKWEAVNEYLKHQGESIMKSYDYVWIPDKNLTVSPNSLVAFFDSIKKQDSRSLFSPKVYTKFRPEDDIKALMTPCFSHTGNFAFVIQSYAPCFKAEFLVKTVAPFLNENSEFLKSGIGIDKWWSKKTNGGSILNTMIIQCSDYKNNEHADKEYKHFSTIRGMVKH